jgi:hypothetical protein
MNSRRPSFEKLTAYASLLAAGVALVTAGILVWQTMFTTRIQTLLQCDAAWSSSDMRATRRRAAAALLNGKPDADVDRVLDFFETITGIYSKPNALGISALPDSWAEQTFYWDAVCYWTKSRSYVNSVRAKPSEHDVWDDLAERMPRWIAEEGAPRPADVDEYLRGEAADPGRAADSGERQ